MNQIKDLRILVAEDNGTFRKLLSAMIERITGIAPVTVENGQEAFSLVSRQAYDLVFMDNHMPLMCGIVATRQIREHVSDEYQPHIVGISGTSDGQELRDLETCGMDALLLKPFHMSELAQLIEDVFEVKADFLAVA